VVVPPLDPQRLSTEPSSAEATVPATVVDTPVDPQRLSTEPLPAEATVPATAAATVVDTPVDPQRLSTEPSSAKATVPATAVVPQGPQADSVETVSEAPDGRERTGFWGLVIGALAAAGFTGFLAKGKILQKKKNKSK
jgi:hypothetical protein